MNNIVEEIVSKLEWRDVLERYGMSYAKTSASGSETTILCPFHDDTSPSLSISISKKLFICRSCGKKGNILQFIQFRENISFGEALRIAAQMTGTKLEWAESDARDAAKVTARIDAVERLVEYAANNLNRYDSDADVKRAVDYLVDTRKFTRGTIAKYKLGFVDIDALLLHADANARTGSSGVSTTHLYTAGMLRTAESGRVQCLPAGQYILFPVLQRGQAVSYTLRRVNDAPVDATDAAAVAAAAKIRRWVHPFNTALENNWLYNEIALHSGDGAVVLCEGVPDAISLEQLDLHAVAVLGVNSLSKHIEKFKRLKRVYVIFDNDDAGRKALAPTARAIIQQLLDGDVFIGTLPLSFDGHNINDINDLLCAGATKEDFIKIINTSVPYVQTLIDVIDKKMHATEKNSKLRNIIELLLSCANPMLKTTYLNGIHTQVGVPAKTVKELQEKEIEARQAREATLAEQRAEKNHQNDLPFAFSAQPILHPTMDFRAGKNFEATRAVYEKQGTSGTWSVINVKYEVLPDGKNEIDVSPDGTVKRVMPTYRTTAKKITHDPESEIGKQLPSPLPPQATLYWDTDPSNPYSANSYYAGKTPKIPTLEILTELIEIFREAVWFEDTAARDGYYVILSCFVMTTHVFPLFDAVPYLWFQGLKSSGKSVALEMLTRLCFNSHYVSNITASSLFRAIETMRSTILIDEAEHLQDTKNNPLFLELMPLINAGYRSDGVAMRTERVGDFFVVKNYSAFSPKVFASINDIDAVTASRTIRICFTSPPKDIMAKIKAQKLNTRNMRARAILLRDKLHCWALQSAPLLAQCIEYAWQDISSPTYAAMSARDAELYVPILTMLHACKADSGRCPYWIDFAAAWDAIILSKNTQDYSNEEKILLAIYQALASNRVPSIEHREPRKSAVVMHSITDLAPVVTADCKDRYDWAYAVAKKDILRVLRKTNVVIGDEKRVRQTGSGDRYYVQIDIDALRRVLETRINASDMPAVDVDTILPDAARAMDAMRSHETSPTGARSGGNTYAPSIDDEYGEGEGAGGGI